MFNRKTILRLCILAGGLAFIFLSIFAFQLGLDNDPGWGVRRFQMLAVGAGLILFAGFSWARNRFATTKEEPLSEEVISKPAGASARKTDILLALVGGAALVVYIWIITVGTMSQWPSGRNYYWQLIQAFQSGHTYLAKEPTPELLALENPYDHLQRKDIDYLWDTSLYNGKYYLYWGPVPAVLGVLANAVTSRPVTDTGLVFLFVLGISLFSILLLRSLYMDGKIQAWVLWGGVFASLLNVPLIWLLTRPTFYEVSISGGQFFMMAGFYLLYLAFRSGDPNKNFLFFSTLAFGLAGGTRINLLPSVVFLAAVIAWRIYAANEKNFIRSFSGWMAAGLPLLVIAIGLASYNYARFGSPLEFGHRYQLTGPSLTADYGDTSSAGYILPNLYQYIFRTPELTGEFPYLRAPWIKEKMWPSFIHLPENYYYTEPVAGILVIVPLTGLAALLLFSVLWTLLNGDVSFRSLLSKSEPDSPSPLVIALLGYFLIQLFILLIFINSAMRYLVDVSPALIVLCVIFASFYARTFVPKTMPARMVVSLWVAAAVITALFGFLIGFTGDKNNFLNKNPQLFYQLHELLSLY